MALIPNLRGEIVEINVINNHHYYKEEVVLKNARQWSFSDGSKDLEGLQSIKSHYSCQEDNLKPGDKVQVLAFPLGEPNTWEHEGILGWGDCSVLPE